MTSILFLVLIFGVAWFLLIRPQSKRRREAQQMQNQLGPGERIQTIGGLHGTIVAMDSETVDLEIAPDVVVTFARQAIARALPTTEAVEETAEATETEAPVAEEPVVEEQAVVEPVAEKPLADPTAEPVAEPVETSAGDVRKKD